MPQKVIRTRSKPKLSKLPLLIVILLILIVIGSLCALFVNFYKERKAADGIINIPTPPAVSLVASSEQNLPGESSSDEASESVSEPKYSRLPMTDTIVPETEIVDNSYFDDAIFIGDSISKGLKLYGVLPENQVIADQNVGINQIVADMDVYYVSAKEKTTLWNAIAKSKNPNPGKIYVLLGTNGIPGFENEKYITFYYTLIDKLKEKFPDAMIYIESLTPITKAVSDRRSPSFTKEKIDDFNKLVLKMAEEKGLYYLKIEDTLTDENGYLKAEYDGGDGTHMPKAGHQAVYAYLKSHAVQPDKTVNVPT